MNRSLMGSVGVEGSSLTPAAGGLYVTLGELLPNECQPIRIGMAIEIFNGRLLANQLTSLLACG